MDNQFQEIATDHIVVDESSQDAVLQANLANLNTLDASEEQSHTPMSTENSTAAAVPLAAPKKAKKSNVGKGKPLKRRKLQFDDEEESEGESSGSTSLGKNIIKHIRQFLFISLLNKNMRTKKQSFFHFPFPRKTSETCQR